VDANQKSQLKLQAINQTASRITSIELEYSPENRSAPFRHYLNRAWMQRTKPKKVVDSR